MSVCIQQISYPICWFIFYLFTDEFKCSLPDVRSLDDNLDIIRFRADFSKISEVSGRQIVESNFSSINFTKYSL